jgi:hypothetical protein
LDLGEGLDIGEAESGKEKALSVAEAAMDAIKTIESQHSQGMHVLNALGVALERMASSSVLLEHQQRLKEYVQKLQTTHSSMADVSLRMETMQHRLNKIRSPYAPHEQALNQKGPFLYECVWQGGVRYREYPHSDAKPRNKVVTFGEQVRVDERVYISGEQQVFLHVLGTGWLFESKDGVQVMRLAPVPASAVATPYAEI